ncbi:NAD(P)/FAD-dependent oxidoreductase [Brumimicrobium aurantiacum]|uniref:FAD-dependent oxidoreductase n=1 Tax=Brumimicrobium aurantiacum TaxID=1737063 RepID=A0A3E1EYC4_9FLAO|nr:FAD-dependent oxidoreductase [Brumimicrobium aurantiacum]RFC54560.1 FAD-dependent oxidoreductase [Brumimicrobium aurantiacum]
MENSIQIQVLPEQLHDEKFILQLANKKNRGSKKDLPFFYIRKRSIDARKKPVKYNLQVVLTEEKTNLTVPHIKFGDVSNAKPIHIIGAGPAGMFAALEAIELGFKPIVFERGKDVRDRRRDLAAINKNHVVNPESNYCFGEGGAGTYSDGKLYTRSKKRGNVLKVLELFVQFGAPYDILVDAHPHIGTNKLPAIITAMREQILASGGEFHFNTKVTDFVLENNQLVGLELNQKETTAVDHVILATGHSARDIFHLLHEKNIKVEAKGFALGVRIEHAQDLIDQIQYHGRLNDELLPPATYGLVTQVNKTGVYSFCMCPGGIVAPCATAPGEVVTNGWSPSKRNNPYSNSGIVVEIDPTRLPNYNEKNPLVGLEFQASVEKACWEAAGKTQAVPAQRMVDFVKGRVSKDLPKSSYQPGMTSVDLNKVLPPFIANNLRQAFKDFGRKMTGYLTNDAVLMAPESRTSSPVAIPRDKESLQHVEIQGLYPCGEGAGYAGGIASAAVDGLNCVQAIIRNQK